jgi:predicted ester cyclase
MVVADTPNKQAVVDYLRARQTRDLDLLDRVVADDFSHEMLGETQDRAGLFAEVEGLPFANGRFEVDALVEEADRVACRYRFSAETPSGRPVSFTGMFIATMRDGQLASGWGEYDAGRLRRQLAE